MDIKKLTEDVLTDLANNKSLESVVNKVQIIAGLLKNDAFSKWIDCELISGYDDKETAIPEYRKVYILEIKADYITSHGFEALQITRQRVPIENLERERYEQIRTVTLYEPITVLEQIGSRRRDVRCNLTGFELGEIQEILGNSHIMQAYKIVSNTYILKIINIAKKKLIDLLMEFNDKIFDGELNIHSSNNADRIQEIVINAGLVQTGSGTINLHDSNVVGGKNQDISISSNQKSELTDILNRIEQEIDEDRTDIAEAILTIRKELNRQTPQFGILKMGFNLIKQIASSSLAKNIETLADKGISYLIES